jgi:tol-pal system protein YbgF
MVRQLNAALTLASALAALLAVVVSDGAPAFAQGQPDLSGLSDRVDRLQRDVDVLQRQLARQGGGAPAASGGASGGPPSDDFVSQTYGRFDTVDGQIRDLTGRVEELTNQVTQLSARLDKLSKDVDFRLSALEKGGAPAAGPAPAGPAQKESAAPKLGAAQVPPGKERLVLVPGPQGMGPGSASSPGTVAPANVPANGVVLPQGSPEAQYEFAYGLLLQAQREQTDFSRPEQAFHEFLAANPNHRLAGNAQYWLGETYYARKDYKDAAAAFAEGVKKYPKSEKAPDNLLKLGMSLALLNRKADACGVLADLNRRFPSAPAPVKTTAQRERSRLGCAG